MNRKMLLPTNLLLFLFLLVFSVPAPAYYDPGVQRWINRDPVGEPGFTERQPMPPMDLEDDASEILKGDQQSKTGEVNLYAFVENRPTNETDPLGLFLGFGYGNYCGWSRRGQGGAPIDALDAACQEHDNCLATWADACKFKFCNLRFCHDVAAANCHGDKACKKAKTKIATGCALMGVVPPLIVM